MVVDSIKINNHLHDLVIEMFQGGEEEERRLEEAERRHNEVYTSLFRQVMDGQIDCFYTFTSGDNQNGRQMIYHRSPKNPGYMQVSYIWYRNGEMIPTMDEQVRTAEEMIGRSSPDNVTVTTYKNQKIA